MVARWGEDRVRRCVRRAEARERGRHRRRRSDEWDAARLAAHPAGRDLRRRALDPHRLPRSGAGRRGADLHRPGEELRRPRRRHWRDADDGGALERVLRLRHAHAGQLLLLDRPRHLQPRQPPGRQLATVTVQVEPQTPGSLNPPANVTRDRARPCVRATTPRMRPPRSHSAATRAPRAPTPTRFPAGARVPHLRARPGHAHARPAARASILCGT